METAHLWHIFHGLSDMVNLTEVFWGISKYNSGYLSSTYWYYLTLNWISVPWLFISWFKHPDNLQYPGLQIWCWGRTLMPIFSTGFMAGQSNEQIAPNFDAYFIECTQLWCVFHRVHPTWMYISWIALNFDMYFHLLLQKVIITLEEDQWEK